MKTLPIEDDVLQSLSAATASGDLVTLPQMSRPLYTKVDRILKVLGGKWNRRAGGHKFDRDIEVEFAAVVEAGEIVDRKQAFGFFPTPLFVVDQMLDLAEMEPGLAVLEPSAGRGAIAAQIVNRWRPSRLACVELMRENANELAACGFECRHTDFLRLTPEPVFDRVIANPPFNRFQYIDHIMHMFGFLRPEGGKIVTVASGGLLSASVMKAKALWQRCEAATSYTVHNMPAGSFKSSGTDVATIMLEIDTRRAT